MKTPGPVNMKWRDQSLGGIGRRGQAPQTVTAAELDSGICAETSAWLSVVTNLEEQLEQFQEELENTEEGVQQLHVQLDIHQEETPTCLPELEPENRLLKDEVEILGLVLAKAEDATVRDHRGLARVMPEKEQKIDGLPEQIAKRQQQLEVTSDNKFVKFTDYFVSPL